MCKYLINFLGEHLSEEFNSLNPFKKVPFIDDKGLVLIERLFLLKSCKNY